MKAGGDQYKPLPIGVDSFEDLITNGYYYVDKTLLIKELLDLKGGVTLFTRPRRFGKTLNMSMLQSYFQLPKDEAAAEKQRQLFSGLAIMETGDSYTKEMGQYPVIFLTLKDVGEMTWNGAYALLKQRLAEEFKRHRAALDGLELLEGDRERADRIMNGKGLPEDYQTSLQFLSHCLKQYYGKKAIILIDEYDVPLETAYSRGYYGEMVNFIRLFFGSALKTNECLAFAVLTGCLRITKESIFTGLNNLKVISVRSGLYAEYFGFTQREVDELLAFYGCESSVGEVKKWYDGYLFGAMEVYNPWSLVKYMEDKSNIPSSVPEAYWANTSGNAIVRTLIEKADAGVKAEIEALMAGGTVEKAVHEDITYDEIEKDMENLWNFLYFTGYLTKASERRSERKNYVTMRIPNEEVLSIYENHIQSWFRDRVAGADLRDLFAATLSGDAQTMEREIGGLLRGSISYMDSKEAFYHGFVVGLYNSLGGHTVDSNREWGDGRPDVALLPESIRDTAVILELKWTDDPMKLEERCNEALKQIREKNYCRDVSLRGYSKVIAYGISFYRKDCVVKVYET